MDMGVLIQSVVTGVLLGGLYALIGVGLTLVFGIMGLTNIAHGDLMILSSFFIMVITLQYTGSVIVAMLITMAIMVVLGYLFQTFLVNKVIDTGSEPSLLVTFGVSIVISNILTQIFGADSRIIPSPFTSINVVDNRWFSISAEYLVNFLIAVAVIVALNLLIKKTYFGRAIRAAASNVTAAELMGVNTKRMYAATMCLSMLTGCVAGTLVGQTFVFYPFTGTQYLIIAFGVVVIGGMGSIVGTLLGGIILGLSQLLGAYFFGSGYQIFTGYIVLLIILTFRPQGLLGNMVRK